MKERGKWGLRRATNDAEAQSVSDPDVDQGGSHEADKVEDEDLWV